MCILTPHSAAQTEEGLRTMAITIAEEVLAVLDGRRDPSTQSTTPAKVEEVRARAGDASDLPSSGANPRHESA